MGKTELTKEDEKLIRIESKEIVHNFIKSYGENPIDYDEVFYNKKQSIGINVISYLKDLVEDILTNNTKQLVDEIAELRNAVNEYHDLYRDSCHENAKLKEQLKQQVECTERIKEICDEYEMQNNKLQSELKAAESVNEWISVEDRLPEDKKRVLVYRTKGFDFENDMFITYILHGKWQNGLNNITHWMPLPTNPI